MSREVMNGGVLEGIHVSDGGVPKRPIDRAVVTRDGLEGDRHAKPGIHGGPLRAVSLYSAERIAALASEGHPIEPGSSGENLTISGLDWDSLEPGARLRVGAGVLLEVTSYAEPCRTISRNFADGRFSRMKQSKWPGWSRLYASVVEEGVVARGDSVVTEGRVRVGSDPGTRRSGDAEEAAQGDRVTMQVQYVNLYVTDLERSLVFFRDTLGMTVQYGDPDFGYASLDVGPIRMGLAQVDAQDDEQRAMVGRQSGIGFVVRDLAAEYERLAAAGVRFPMKPARQPWGAVMATFEDPDGNVFYLDEQSEA